MRYSTSKFLALWLAVSLLGACTAPEPPASKEAARPPAPQIPADVQAAAEASLGLEVTVLAHGDLSLTGQPHILAANLLKSTPTGVAPGTLFSRLAILAQEDGKWKEIFICTSHLQNRKGYLGGTPLVAINGWRLQKEMNKKDGLVMYFTPIRQPVTGAVKPIGVRWNPKTKRYQSLDFNYANFLDEVKALERPESFLR